MNVIAAADICGIAMQVMRHNSQPTHSYIYPARLCARARSAYGVCSGFLGIHIFVFISLICLIFKSNVNLNRGPCSIINKISVQFVNEIILDIHNVQRKKKMKFNEIIFVKLYVTNRSRCESFGSAVICGWWMCNNLPDVFFFSFCKKIIKRLPQTHCKMWPINNRIRV